MLHHLRKEGPRSAIDIMNQLNVPSEEKRKVYRAIKDLKELDVVKEKNRLLYPYGHEEPETIKVTVGPRALRLTIPLKKELAKRLLKRRPLIRRVIAYRKGFIHEILLEAGFLEEGK